MEINKQRKIIEGKQMKEENKWKEINEEGK